MSEPIVVSLTGVAEIDAQHAQLVKCLDDLMEFVGGIFEFSAVFTAIQALLDYTQQHFAYEEQLMSDWGYPLLNQHIDEHGAIESDVRALWAKVEAGDEVLAEQLVLTIRTWIVDHINAEDIEFAKFRETSA